jgi:hypothetical protein
VTLRKIAVPSCMLVRERLYMVNHRDQLNAIMHLVTGCTA